MKTPNADPQAIHQQVSADLADLPFRRPIIDYLSAGDKPPTSAGELSDQLVAGEQAYSREERRTDLQWRVVTNAARLAITNSPGAREAAKEFSVMPLDETLPLRAISTIAKHDQATGGLLARSSDKLGARLALDAVPDELLKPDVKHAAPLLRPEQQVAFLSRIKTGMPQHYKNTLENVAADLAESPGVSAAEQKLVLQRYGYGRDIKLLGLMAELHDQPIDATQVHEGLVRQELPSGTKLAVTAEALAEHPSIMDPSTWEGRMELKDRVYAVSVDGKPYVLKERKTSRHKDTLDRGHRDGLTSEQEFEAAQAFAKHGTIDQGEVAVRWEKPVGYAEFPDGYQFCLFEHESTLDTDTPREALADDIMEQPDVYAAEFKQLQATAKAVYEQNKAAFYKPDTNGGLTFAEFAKVKSDALIQEAQLIMEKTMADEGYANTDQPGRAYKVASKKGEPTKLEMVAFDLEYYRKSDDDEAARIKQHVGTDGPVPNQHGQRPMEWAAAYALSWYLKQRTLKK